MCIEVENNQSTNNNISLKLFKDVDDNEIIKSSLSETYHISLDKINEIYNIGLRKLIHKDAEQPFIELLHEKYNFNINDANEITDYLIIQARKKKEYFHKDIYRDENGNIEKEIIYNSNYIPNNHIIDKTISKNYIDARQAGIGKTQEIVDIINSSKGKNLIIGSSHDFLEDVKPRLNKEFIQLKGFEKGCVKFEAKTDEGKLIRSMYQDNVPNKIICMCLKCKNRCHYREQFKKAAEDNVDIGAPVEFLHIYDFNDFDNVFIEERVQRSFNITWNIKTIKSQLMKIKPYIDEYIKHQKNKKAENINPNLYDDIVEAFRTKNIEYIRYKANWLSNIIEKSNEVKVLKHHEYMKHNDKIQFDKKFSNQICTLRINNLLMFLEFEQRECKAPNEETRTIKIPYQEFIFYKQMHCKKSLRYNCASFVDFEFLYYLQQFEKLFPEYTGYVEVRYSHFTNPEFFKIIKMGNQGFYKSTIKQNLKEHRNEIKNLIYYNKSKNKRICILTFKNWVKNDKFMGCDAFWFGGKHGINTFRDYDILIVLGTYLPNKKAYEEYMEIHHPDEDYNLDYLKRRGEFLPNDSKLMEYYEKIFQADIIDSVHRLRALWRQEEIKVYWFGNNIPEALKVEAEYIEKTK